MKKNVRTLLQIMAILLVAGITAKAQPVQVSIVPDNSTNFTTIGDLVYFTVNDVLWRTDGTAEGTIALRSGLHSFAGFTDFNGKLVFRHERTTDPSVVAYKELWVSDGTPDGTTMLKASTDYDVQIAGIIGDRLFFSATESATGLELYVTDGTPGGTMLVRDLNPGSANGYGFSSAPIGNVVFFEGNDGGGWQLWKTDGTSAGTVPIADINGTIGQAFSHQDKYYFMGDTPEYGTEPWVSDGTQEGTMLLRDIAPGAESIGYHQFMIGNNGDVYFFILSKPDEEHGANVWKTSGTPASTVKVTTSFEDGFDHWFTNFLLYKDKFFFFDESDGALRLWYTDGTESGTGSVWRTDVGEGWIRFAEVVNNLILFYPDVQGFPYRFERTDGTPEGTQTFDIFHSGSLDRGPRDVTKVNDLVFYGDHDQDTDRQASPENWFQLIQSDGFTTRSVKSIHGGSYSGVVDIANYNGKVLFTTLNDYDEIPDEGKQLWIYDPAQAADALPHFTLVNAGTDDDIARLNDGDSFEIADGVDINIRFTPADSASYVVFELNYFRVRTETQPPYSLAGDIEGDYAPWKDAAPGTYVLTATPFTRTPDGQTTQGEALTITFTIEGIPECNAAGTILREYWDNISGNMVSSIPTNTTPTSTSQLTIFEGPTNVDTNYGARISGYICAPASGDYTFWISSNDHSELWLSTDDSPHNKKKIAYITGATNPRQWDKFSTQKSSPITLIAGHRYYIEALHKQGIGTDHVAVGWQLPDGTLERPIAGSRLSPFTDEPNMLPFVDFKTPVSGQTYEAPATVYMEAQAIDYDGTVTKVVFYWAPDGAEDFDELIRLGEDDTAPYTFTWSDVPPGEYDVYAEAYDNDGAASGVPGRAITVLGSCAGGGTISREYWANVYGNRVSDIPVNTEPTSIGELSSFEGPSNIGTNYGARIRGYLCPPESGDYRFAIASNDHSELWLSTDDDAANKRLIAYVTGATAPGEYTKFASQRSAVVTLAAGQRYYIEALHKQGAGTDHVSVVWMRPGAGWETNPIPGGYLSPYISGGDATGRMAGNSALQQEERSIGQVSIYPNPATANERELMIAGYEGIDETIETDVEIVNMTGDVVFSERVLCGGDCASYILKINKQLVPGVYLVNLKMKEARFSKRLLVK